MASPNLPNTAEEWKTTDPAGAAVTTINNEPLDPNGEKDVIELTSSDDGESDKEVAKRPGLETQKSYATTASGVSRVTSNAQIVQKKPFYKKLNPLRWGDIPPVPQEREISHEYGAGFWSLLVFQWMRPLMSVGYARTLEPNDIWKVNPDRAADVMVNKLQASFDMRVARGDQYPLLWALHETFKKEFWLGGVAQLCANIFQVTTVLSILTLCQD